MDPAVVLCSGGLNSAVLAAVAAQEHALALLHVRYGHRAADRDAECFAALADYFDPAERLIVDMPHFAAIGGNSRMDEAVPVEPYCGTRDHLSATHIPGLIGSLLCAARTWSHRVGAERIYVGVCENLGPPAPRTSSIWPEYSREYIYYWNHLLGAASVDQNITLEAPLIDLCRADIIRLGQRLGAPLDRTWTCIASGSEACGQCTGCATRARGFTDAGSPDPLLVPAGAQ